MPRAPPRRWACGRRPPACGSPRSSLERRDDLGRLGLVLLARLAGLQDHGLVLEETPAARRCALAHPFVPARLHHAQLRRVEAQALALALVLEILLREVALDR